MLDLSGTGAAGWAVAGAVLMRIVDSLLRRAEGRETRALAAQGAAGDEWQQLAEHYRDRIGDLELENAQLRADLMAQGAAWQSEVEGLEGRLRAAGVPVRHRPRPATPHAHPTRTEGATP